MRVSFLFLFCEPNSSSRRACAIISGHVVSIVHRTPGQLFSGTLGLLRPSSAATKEKQEAERRERDGVDIRGAGNDEKAKARICWFKPVDKRSV
jgi:protein SSD1